MEDARWKEHPCFRNRIEFPSCSFQEKCGRREGGLPTNLTLARLVTVCYGRENKSFSPSISVFRAAFILEGSRINHQLTQTALCC